LRLLLLRHAKSDWSGQAGDHDRPLSPRGRKAMPRVAAHMKRLGYQPHTVLCSTATRAEETLELLLAQIETPPSIHRNRALYLAEWPLLLAEIRAVEAGGSPLLVIGHNPGLEQLALALALQPQSPAERARTEKLAAKFPTAALAVLDFDIADWSEAKPGSGKLVDYVRPKDLRVRSQPG
jgi:phosphohistidine phosphatase